MFDFVFDVLGFMVTPILMYKFLQLDINSYYKIISFLWGSIVEMTFLRDVLKHILYIEIEVKKERR